MSQEKCESCCQRHDCEGIYRKLGGAAGPSVTLSVVIAFLSPILVFILSLAGAEKAVGLFTKTVELRTGLGLFAAVAATFLWILGARVIHGRLSRSQ
jgi:hypothetical protein